ncbi:unnamed protein product [Brassica oleracea]
MTSGDFEIAGISTGKWWSSPTNSTTAISDGKTSITKLTIIMMILLTCTTVSSKDYWIQITNYSESFLDYETKEPKEIITQDCKNLTSKAQLEETSGDYSPRLLKRPGMDSLSPLPRFKVRKEKLGDRVTGLQQLVSPFGKNLTPLHNPVHPIVVIKPLINSNSHSSYDFTFNPSTHNFYNHDKEWGVPVHDDKVSQNTMNAHEAEAAAEQAVSKVEAAMTAGEEAAKEADAAEAARAYAEEASKTLKGKKHLQSGKHILLISHNT